MFITRSPESSTKKGCVNLREIRAPDLSLRQSLSSVVDSTCRGFEAPNRGVGASSAEELALNLDPLDHSSSLSAIESTGTKPALFFLVTGGSDSMVEGRGREDRQSFFSSATLGGGARSEPSNRLRGGTRSGRGPSLRQGLSNFASSSCPPPNPDLSFAGTGLRRKFTQRPHRKTHEAQPR